MEQRRETALKSRAELFSDLFNKLTQFHLKDPDIVDKLKESVKLDEVSRGMVGSSGLDLLIQLRVNGLLTPENVDALLEALIACDQKGAAQLVNAYIQETGISTAVSLPDLSHVDTDPEVCSEHGEPMELLCNTCNVTICFGCAFHKHRDHEVISEEDCEPKVEEAISEVNRKSEALVKTVNRADEILESLDCKGKANELIRSSFETWSALIESHRESIEAQLRKRVQTKAQQTEALKESLDKAAGVLRKREAELDDADDGLEKAVQLKMWRELNRTVTEAMESFRTQQSVLMAYDQSYCSYIPISESGRYVDVGCGTVIGGICVREDSIIMVRDNRNFGHGVSAVCMPADNREKVYWKRELSKQDERFPIVVSDNLFVPGISHARALIACGDSLTAISVANGNINFQILNLETKTLDIPEGSYVTAMTPITDKNCHSGMLIAESSSVVIQEFDIQLRQVNTLDCTGCIQSILNMASSGDLVAIIDAVADQVVLIKAGKEPHIRGKLKPPQSNIVLMPKFIQWDGNFWGLVWEGTSNRDFEGPEWVHRSYHESGKDVSTDIQSGVCDENAKVVGLSYFGRTSVACFSNSKTLTYSSNPANAGEERSSRKASDSSTEGVVSGELLRRLQEMMSQ